LDDTHLAPRCSARLGSSGGWGVGLGTTEGGWDHGFLECGNPRGVETWNEIDPWQDGKASALKGEDE